MDIPHPSNYQRHSCGITTGKTVELIDSYNSTMRNEVEGLLHMLIPLTRSPT
jgi:hypothetical protein